MAEPMVDHPVHLEDLMNLNVDPDAAMVDPQLAMPYFGGLSGKASEQLTIDPSMWQNPFESFNGSPEHFNSFTQAQGDQPAGTDRDTIDSATNASSPTVTARPHMTGKASRTSSKSSVPSLSSGSSSPGKRTRSKTAAKKAEPRAPPRTKSKAKKQVVAEMEDDVDENDMDDSKRNKYLERNRIAASKCRQKKKAWVSDLESQKSDLEATHGNLQREYGALVDQVTQLKNDLMMHAGCGDPNIDSWIETEAKRFVQRTTDRSDDNRRRTSNCDSIGRRPSLSDHMIQQSPTTSNDGFPTSPIIKQEEINYDHMPDDMFD